jgi:ABC-2 type transport system ATP-binding protein
MKIPAAEQEPTGVLMIEVRDLSKRYGDKLAVDHLTFTVRPGMVTGFLGPNGAGKSTTMRVILGLDRPTNGSATVNGKPYRDHRAPLREVGAILEARAIHTGRSAYMHLLALGQTHGIPRSRVDEVIALVGLQDVARKRVGTFSLGMGQRLGIAAALLGDPKTLILDEPSNGLDPEGIRWIRNLLRSLADEGRTILVSSHLMSEMSMMADWLIVVGRGRLIADTTVDGFVQLAAGDAVRVRTPDIARLRLLAGALEGVTVKEDLTGDSSALTLQGISCEAVGELAAANRIVLHELSPEQASLEEAFMRLTMDSVEYHAAPTANEASVGAAR